MKTLEIDNAYQLAASIGATDHLIEQATKEPLGEATNWGNDERSL